VREHLVNQGDLPELLFQCAQANQGKSVVLPPTRNRWHLVSALQKSIRRGHVDWALGCAAALFEQGPQYVFRRLSIIALEDVGPGDWLMCALTLEAASGAHLRRKIGEKAVLLSLVAALAAAAKSRSLSDGSNLICGKRSEDWPELVSELPPLLQSIAQRGRSLEGLVAALPGVWRARENRLVVVSHAPDRHGDEMIAGLPAATFDKHTHEGLRAIATLASRFTPRQLGLVVFYTEGCHVDRELTWPGHDLLQAQSHQLDYLTKYGFESPQHVNDCERFVSREREALNSVRRKLLRS